MLDVSLLFCFAYKQIRKLRFLIRVARHIFAFQKPPTSRGFECSMFLCLYAKKKERAHMRPLHNLTSILLGNRPDGTLAHQNKHLHHRTHAHAHGHIHHCLNLIDSVHNCIPHRFSPFLLSAIYLRVIL